MLSQSMNTNSQPLRRNALQAFSWKEYFALVSAGMIGVLSALPSAGNLLERTAVNAKVPVQVLAAGQLLQSAFWMLLTVGIGLTLAARTGLGAPLLRSYFAGERVGRKLRSYVLPAVMLALFTTMLVTALDRLYFAPRMPGFSSAISQVSGWKGILVSLYGGITEEILTRLFLVTLLAWILSWFRHTDDGRPTPAVMWIAILSVAVIFGLGHLPATLASTPFSMTVLARAIVLNGMYGTVFGYLYWKRGLESSMMCHFASDLLVHVILPAVVLYLQN